MTTPGATYHNNPLLEHIRNSASVLAFVSFFWFLIVNCDYSARFGIDLALHCAARTRTLLLAPHSSHLTIPLKSVPPVRFIPVQYSRARSKLAAFPGR